MRTIAATLVLLFLTACGGSNPAQNPPAGADDLLSWLAEGHYLRWHCEPAPHPARFPSPHLDNRICQNDLASGHGAGEYPVGAASVKELYDGAGSIQGYSVSRHVSQGKGGASWYWFEVAGDSVHADGAGGSGVPLTSCVGCHQLAGTPGYAGHDFVWTQVR